MSTPNIHDSTIKYFLSDRLNAISLLKSMLPEKIKLHISFTNPGQAVVGTIIN